MSATIDNLRQQLILVQQQLDSDWERIRLGGIYDRAKREVLFATKRQLLNELTTELNPSLPVASPSDPALPQHESDAPLLVRALNVAQRMTFNSELTEAEERARRMDERIRAFSVILLQTFTVTYRTLRETCVCDITRDDPLTVCDRSGVYFSYFLDTGDLTWKVQAGVETEDGVMWHPYPVANMLELGNAIEAILRGDAHSVPYRHEPRVHTA